MDQITTLGIPKAFMIVDSYHVGMIISASIAADDVFSG